MQLLHYIKHSSIFCRVGGILLYLLLSFLEIWESGSGNPLSSKGGDAGESWMSTIPLSSAGGQAGDSCLDSS